MLQELIMHILHKIVQVTNNQIIIDLPSDFTDKEVEVILKPLTQDNQNYKELEKEIDIGINSPISQKSHIEIFDSLRKKYESG
jgi:hypothetical protein